MGRVYREQFQECSKCHRLRPRREIDRPAKSGRCIDREHCATAAPEYDEEIARMNQREFGIEFLAACKWCGAYHTPATFRALKPAAVTSDVRISTLVNADTHEVLAKECDCGNRIIRTLKKVLPC